MTEMKPFRAGRGTATLCLAMLLGGGAGCGAKYDDLKSFVQAHEGDVAATDYRVDPPDVLVITSPSAPEIDGATVTVGVDGKISLNLVGDVKVSSLTPREIAMKLEELLGRYYVEPKVDVHVAGYQSKQIFVFGEVGAPGPKPFTGRDTVLEVLGLTQLTRLAWGAQVKVIRPSADPAERHEVVIDVDRMMQTGDLTQNFLLQEGDIVYVPPTPLAWAGLRMQDVLFPVQNAQSLYSAPISFIAATDYYKSRGNSTTVVRFSNNEGD